MGVKITSADDPSVEELKGLFDYCGESGALIWKKRPESQFKSSRDCKAWNTLYAGKRAGGLHKFGYRRLAINGKSFKEHRVVWAICYGEWPPSELDIDHINQVKDDNRIENLRLATRSENMRNTKIRSHNKSGLKGAYRCSRSGKWRSVIVREGKQDHLGLFDTHEEAHKAYCRAADRLHGEFAHHGN